MPDAPPRFLSAPALVAALWRDARTYSPQAAALRLTRKWAARRLSDDIARLARLSPYRTHVAAVDPGDPLFFLAHRHYLITDLDRAARTRAALYHYTTEAQQFTADYHAALSRTGRLALWSEQVDGVTYAIWLTPAQDVLHEGGNSLVLTVDGDRIAVLSYVWLAEGIAQNPAPLPLITRKQLTQARSHQSAFNKAFDRATPGHLLMAAFAAIAQGLGHHQALGLSVARHPAATPAVAAPMRAAYDEFWSGLGGQLQPGPNPAGWLLPLPLALTPLADVSASHRRRALDRRAHMDRIAAASAVSVTGLLVSPSG